jgi:hypothetical protein
VCALFAQAEINVLSDMLTRLIKQKLLQTRVLQNGTSMPMQAKTAANVAREVGSDAVAFMVCIHMALMHLMQYVIPGARKVLWGTSISAMRVLASSLTLLDSCFSTSGAQARHHRAVHQLPDVQASRRRPPSHRA